MIILEGPDGTGKSTLAELLGKRYDAPVHKIGSTPGSPQAIVEYCETCDVRASQFVIQDRITPVSEAVYAKVLNRPIVPSSVLDFWTRLIFRQPGKPVFVYCRVDDLTQVTHHENPDDPNDTPEYLDLVTRNMRAVRDEYDAFFLRHTYPTNPFIVYDYTTTPLEALYEQLSDHVSGRT